MLLIKNLPTVCVLRTVRWSCCRGPWCPSSPPSETPWTAAEPSSPSPSPPPQSGTRTRLRPRSGNRPALRPTSRRLFPFPSRPRRNPQPRSQGKLKYRGDIKQGFLLLTALDNVSIKRRFCLFFLKKYTLNLIHKLQKYIIKCCSKITYYLRG